MIKIVSIVLLLLVSSSLASTVDLGKISIQLKSSSDQDVELLSGDMLALVSVYLNEYFEAFYVQTESTDYFSSATLTVRDLSGTQGIAGSFVTTLEFGGMLMFKVDPGPSHAFIDTLTVNAFEGLNLDLFIEAILSNRNEFLQHLQHIVVEVRDDAVTEKVLANPTTLEKDIPQNNTSTDQGLTGWLAILVYTMAIVSGIVLSICCYGLLKCCCFSDAGNKEPVSLKSIEVPKSAHDRITKQNQKKKRKKNMSRQTEPLQPRDPPATVRDNEEDVEDSFFLRPPSPIRSITSQDSSKFTYTKNDMSLMSYNNDMSMMSQASQALGNVNDSYMSYQPRRQQPQVNISSLGNEMSIIDYKDQTLDLIEEGNEENYHFNIVPSRTYENKKKSTDVLQVRPSKSRSRPKSRVPSFRSPRYSNIGNSAKPSSSPTSSEGTNNDVIDDLNNLSMQIQMMRSGR